ncbi:MAG TPA: hypothetical protein VGG33_14275 [Polyangia bacterium]
MSDDEAKTTPRLFDVRTIERNIRKGLTTRKDYDKYLKSLPDVAEKAAPNEPALADIDDDEDDFDDEDEDDEDEDLDQPVAAAPAASSGASDAPANNVPDGHGSPSNDTTP